MYIDDFCSFDFEPIVSMLTSNLQVHMDALRDIYQVAQTTQVSLRTSISGVDAHADSSWLRSVESTVLLLMVPSLPSSSLLIPSPASSTHSKMFIRSILAPLDLHCRDPRYIYVGVINTNLFQYSSRPGLLSFVRKKFCV